MYSRKTLGTVALVALATAAVSFAVVDVSTSISAGCQTAGAACDHTGTVPIVAVTSAALGFLALGAGILPAVMWIVASVQANRTQVDGSDEEIAREHRRALHGDDLGLAAPLPGQPRPAQPDDDEHDDEQVSGVGHA